MNEFYVYAIVNPIDSIPFYIGKGKGDRAYSHLKRSHNKMNNAAISALNEIGIKPLVVIIKDNLTETDSLKLEQTYIDIFGRKNSKQIPCAYGYPVLNNMQDNSGLNNSDKILESVKRKVICPVCGMTGGQSAMKRWHFSNCINDKILKLKNEGHGHSEISRMLNIDRSRIISFNTFLKKRQY
jgi:hypothetical protein